MKLAEALLLRTDLKNKITQLEARLKPILIAHRMKPPQEDPLKILNQLRDTIFDYEKIIEKINNTNNKTLIDDKKTLMMALVERDSQKILIEKLRSIRNAAVVSNKGIEEIKSTIDIKNLQIEIDQCGRLFREIDTKIQAMNWVVNLEEN